METTASPITDARLQAAYEYWCRIAEDRPMPRRRDLDPTDIPKLLPHVMLVDVDGGRYRYRLIGTANAQEHGMNATGRYVDEVLKGPEYRAHALRLYDEAVKAARPVYSESVFLAPSGGAIERHTKALFMPLSEDGRAVSQVLVAQIFLYLDQKMRDQHFLVARPFKQIVRARL
jgi:hypothetical protein